MAIVSKGINSQFGLEKTNVVFLTLDCCRYDTLLSADAPFLKSVGLIAKASTHGTYTLPAHMSFFMGYLPNSIDVREPYYLSEQRQLWRLRSGRPRNLESVGITLDGSNVLAGYKALGFTTVGSGGVRWFRNQTLTKLFDHFFYYGPDIETSVFAERRKVDFPLFHADEILTTIQGSKNYFLFVNCPETHVPYDFGEGIFSEEVKEIIEKAAPWWGCKTPLDGEYAVTRDELKKLHSTQIKAMEMCWTEK